MIALWKNPAGQAQARASALGLQWWWQRHLGLPGAAAVLLAGVALAIMLAVRPGLQRAQQAQQLQMDTKLGLLAARSAALPAAGQRDPLEAWLDTLPPVQRRGESIAQLLKLLGRGGVAADSADYVAEDHEPGLLRLQVTVPIKGGYLPTRTLLASILNAMPHAALDALELDRAPDADETLVGQLRLSLFFRKAAR